MRMEEFDLLIEGFLTLSKNQRIEKIVKSCYGDNAHISIRVNHAGRNYHEPAIEVVNPVNAEGDIDLLKSIVYPNKRAHLASPNQQQAFLNLILKLAEHGLIYAIERNAVIKHKSVEEIMTFSLNEENLSEGYKPETAKDLPAFQGQSKGYVGEVEAQLNKAFKADGQPYYNQYPIEVIDMMIALFGKEKTADFCLLNAFKYRMRVGRKDDTAHDLAKEEWYLKKYKELTINNQ